MSTKPKEPSNIIDPTPKPEPPPKSEPSHVTVNAEIDYDKLAEKVSGRIGEMLKPISDPISEMLGILKPPKLDPPKADPPPPAPPVTKQSIIPYFD